MTQHETALPPSFQSVPEGKADAVTWRVTIAAIAVGIGALIALFFDTANSMFDLWSRMHAYDHAFLVIPVSLYLVWERRHRLAVINPRPNLFGLLLLAAFGVAWLVADTVDVIIGRQFALIGMVESLVFALLGWRAFRMLLFPLLFIWLILPTDLNLLPFLQKIATMTTSWGIAVLGIPVFVEGNYIEIPSGRYWVAPGCAGLNFLLSGFALSLLYVEQMYDSWPKRIAGVAAMIVVAVVANWFRIFGLIVAGHHLDEVYDINDHYLEGWLFFAAIVFLMMWLGLRFRDPVRDEEPASRPRDGAAGVRRHWTAAIVFAALAVAIAGIFPAYASYKAQEAMIPVQATLVLPDTIGAWRAADGAADWRPQFSNTHAEALRRYTQDRQFIDLYAGYYALQGSGRELIAYHNRVYDPEAWRQLRVARVTGRIGGRSVAMVETLLRGASERRVVRHVYWVDGRYTVSNLTAKLLQAKADLLTGDRRSGVLAVSLPEDADRKALDGFLASLPPFESLIGPSAAGN